MTPFSGSGISDPRGGTSRPIGWETIAPAIFLFVLPIARTTPLRVTCLVLSLVALVLAFRRQPRGERLPASLVVAIAFWFCVCLAASFASIEPDYSWGEFRNEVLSTTVAFFVFYGLTSDDRVWHRWRAALLASFAAVAAIAIFSYLRGDGWSRAGLVGDRNAYSTYIVLIVPFLLLQWLEGSDGSRRTWRIAMSVAVVLALVSGAFTQNRNMWFGIAIEFIVFAALVWMRHSPEERRRLRVRYLAATVLGAVVFVGTMAYVVQQKAVVSKTSTEEQARFDRDPRLEIWAYAVERIRERPWFGYGYGRGILRQEFRTHFDNPLKWHGHNMVVDYWLEAGVFGGVAIVGLFAAFIRHSWRIYRSRDRAIWPLGAWSLVMISGIVIKVMTDDILVRDSSLLFWSSLGISFGLASRLRRTGASEGDGERR